MALQMYRRKRPRRESSDAYSVEEISADDMGYEGDIEVLLPDQYEEPDSDFEDDQALRRLWPDTDEELATKLRRLSCDTHSQRRTHPQDGERGRKRMSREMDDEDAHVSSLKHTEIEVSELIDGHVEQPPPKRRKNRNKNKNTKPPLGQRVAKKQAAEAWSDSSDRSDDAMVESSTGTPDGTNTPSTPMRNGGAEEGDLDAMDIG